MEEQNIPEIIIPFGSREFVVVADVVTTDVDCIIEALEAERSESPDLGGRPTKLTSDFIAAAESVLNDDINAIICTDDELLVLINEQLEESARIDDATFKRWKAKNKDGQSDILDPVGLRFCAVIKRALIKQKQDLFTKLRKETTTWQRWAWIIERKFGEWNLRHEVSGPGGGPIKSATASVAIPAADVSAGQAVKNYTIAELEKILETTVE